MRDTAYRTVQRCYQYAKAIIHWHTRPLVGWWHLPADRKGVIFTGVIALATVMYVFYASLQWQTMERQFELSERPWVSVPNASFLTPLTFSPKGITATIQLVLTNTGHSPAINVRVETGVVPWQSSDYSTTAVMEQRKLCTEARQHHMVPQAQQFLGGGADIFPNEHIYHNFTINMTGFEMFRAMAPLAGGLSLIVIGCVQYEFAFQKGDHQTPLMFAVGHTDPTLPPGALILGISPDVFLSKMDQTFEYAPVGLAPLLQSGLAAD